MENEQLKIASTIELIKELTFLEQKIDLLLLKRQYIREELFNRIPNLAENENFKERYSNHNNQPQKHI